MADQAEPYADTVRWLTERIADEKAAVTWHERMGSDGSAACHEYARRAFIEARTRLLNDGQDAGS